MFNPFNLFLWCNFKKINFRIDYTITKLTKNLHMVNPYSEAVCNIRLVSTNHIIVNTKLHFNIPILESTNLTTIFRIKQPIHVQAAPNKYNTSLLEP